MVPSTSAASLVLVIGLTSGARSLMDLRTFADWTLRPRLLGVPGIAKVVVFGGEVRQMQVQVRPERLLGYGLAIEDVLAAARRATGVRGAGFVETEAQRIVLRTEGQRLTPTELGEAVLAHREGAVVRLRDVANVLNAPEPKVGDGAIDGHPGVLLVLSSQFGENTEEVTEAVERALDEMAPERILLGSARNMNCCARKVHSDIALSRHQRFDELAPEKLGQRRAFEVAIIRKLRKKALAGVIAGEDRGAKTALELKAKSLGLTRNDLTFAGECDRVPALLSQAALLVLSSDYEGFPNVILEAMAARLPVITTPAGDAHLVVQHGKTGYVVEMNDIQGLAACMVQLARSPSMRKEFGEAGRKRVEQEYNYESLGNRLIAIFRSFARKQRRVFLLEMLERGIPTRKTETLSGALLLEGPAA